jgi:hypothetical protein
VDLHTLIALAEEMARERADGHLTILRFTTHWKVVFGTPHLDMPDGRFEVQALVGYSTLEAALAELIARPVCIGDEYLEVSADRLRSEFEGQTRLRLR